MPSSEDILNESFISLIEDLEGEEEDRSERAKNLSKFGIKFLDDACLGIGRNDLVVMGARSGAGKSELSTVIAEHNIKNKKRVYLFALEAERKEISRRLKYRLLADLYYTSNLRKEYLNYVQWNHNKQNHLVSEFNEKVNRIMADEYATLNIRYRESNFNLDDLANNVYSVRNNADLILLDHLAYIDTDEINDLKGMKKIMMLLRDMSLDLGIPIIVFAQLRKTERGNKQIVPDMEEILGSSIIYQNATKVILFSSAKDKAKSPVSYRFPTWIYVSKQRIGGAISNYAAMVNFDIRYNVYDEKYKLVRLKNYNTDYEDIELEDYPIWMKIL